MEHPPEPQAERTWWGYTHLEDLLVVFGGVEPTIPHDVLHQLLVVLCNTSQNTPSGHELSLVPKPLVTIPEPAAPQIHVNWG